MTTHKQTSGTSGRTPDDGGPAFPQYLTTEQSRSTTQGMSVRDYFAAQALASIIAAPNRYLGKNADEITNNWAILAYLAADALLRARKS